MLISSSPNWYASAVLTSISDKQFVFASRTSLFSYLFDDENGELIFRNSSLYRIVFMVYSDYTATT